jgi:hypothetical protein
MGASGTRAGLGFAKIPSILLCTCTGVLGVEFDPRIIEASGVTWLFLKKRYNDLDGEEIF